jgi:hypothetical protein
MLQWVYVVIELDGHLEYSMSQIEKDQRVMVTVETDTPRTGWELKVNSKVHYYTERSHFKKWIQPCLC